MSRRLIYIAFGAAVGVLVVQRVTKTAKRLTPANVQSSFTASIANFGDAIRELTAEVKQAMSEREDELRSTLGLDGSHDVVDSDTPPPGA